MRVKMSALLLAALVVIGWGSANAGTGMYSPAWPYVSNAKDPLTAKCEEGIDNRDSDLCAQWKAADAARDSADIEREAAETAESANEIAWNANHIAAWSNIIAFIAGVFSFAAMIGAIAAAIYSWKAYALEKAQVFIKSCIAEWGQGAAPDGSVCRLINVRFELVNGGRSPVDNVYCDGLVSFLNEDELKGLAFDFDKEDCVRIFLPCVTVNSVEAEGFYMGVKEDTCQFIRDGVPLFARLRVTYTDDLGGRSVQAIGAFQLFLIKDAAGKEIFKVKPEAKMFSRVKLGKR